MANSLISYIGEEMYKKYWNEFDALAQIGFYNRMWDVANSRGITNKKVILDDFRSTTEHYIAIKSLGYKELAIEIENQMIDDPIYAGYLIELFSNLISRPFYNPLKPVHIFNKEYLTRANKLGKPHGFKVHEKVPYEIGKSLLNKLVIYPETYEGCMKLIQEYNDYELNKVYCALNEGIKNNNIDLIENKKIDISEILDNVWNDADKIKKRASAINFGVSLDISLIGELATGLSGIGILAGLGFQAVDKLWGNTSESLSEKIAKSVSPNYLVSIYEFKKEHVHAI